jgi:four helix bundle protein
LYAFALSLINAIDGMPKNDLVARRLSDQLLRSGTSVLGNYVEGVSGSSRKDMANFFKHSLKSSNESKVWICLLRDSKRMKSETAKALLSELNAFSKILTSSVLTLKGFERNRQL